MHILILTWVCKLVAEQNYLFSKHVSLNTYLFFKSWQGKKKLQFHLLSLLYWLSSYLMAINSLGSRAQLSDLFFKSRQKSSYCRHPQLVSVFSTGSSLACIIKAMTRQLGDFHLRAWHKGCNSPAKNKIVAVSFSFLALKPWFCC